MGRPRALSVNKKGPNSRTSSKLGPDSDSGFGGMRAPFAAIQTDPAVFISTYRSLRLPLKVKNRLSALGTNGEIASSLIVTTPD